MTLRQKLASDVSPLLLRAALGVTFAYMAMWGFAQGEYSGKDAAVLAHVGVINQPPPPTVQNLVEDVPPMTPDENLGASRPGNDDPPTDGSEADPPTDENDVDTLPQDVADNVEVVQPAGATAEGEPVVDALPGHDEDADAQQPAESPTISLENDLLSVESAETMFPDPLPARRLHSVTVLMYESSHIGPTGGRTPLPGWIGTGRAPVIVAYVVVGASALGAVLLVLGFLTRLASLMLFVVMLGSIWLLEIAPVVVGGSPGMFGFLPAHDDFSIHAWAGLMWQLVLLGGLFSVCCSGAGLLSLDRFLMGSPTSEVKRIGSKKRLMPPLEEEEPTPKRPL